MKKLLIFLSGLLLAGVLNSRELSPDHCDQFFPYGRPVVSVATTGLCRISYHIEYDNQNKIPLYSVELLLVENIGGTVKRTNRFIEDLSVEQEFRSTNNDYRTTGFDRGHMAAADDFTTDTASMRQSFLLSNVVPQAPDNNRGVWKTIEMQQRAWARTRSGLFIYTGSIASSSNFVGNRVNVPDFLYKVVIDRSLGQCVAFIVPNLNSVSKKILDYIVPCSTVEHHTGLNFTPRYQLDKSMIGESFSVKSKK